MKTQAKSSINRRGSSLLECVVTLITMSVSLTALLGYRYYCVKSIENTESFTMAARTGHMIAEIWASQKGNSNYDLSNLAFCEGYQVRSGSDSPAEIPSGFIQTGCYDVLAEGRIFGATLAYQDSEDIPGLRNLYIILTWTGKSGQEQSYTFSSMTQSLDETSESESVASEAAASAMAEAEMMAELSSTKSEEMRETHPPR